MATSLHDGWRGARGKTSMTPPCETLTSLATRAGRPFNQHQIPVCGLTARISAGWGGKWLKENGLLCHWSVVVTRGCRCRLCTRKSSVGWSAVTRAQSGRREVEVGKGTWGLPRWPGCPSEARELQQANSWAGALSSSFLDLVLSRTWVQLGAASSGPCTEGQEVLHRWAE